MKKLLLGLMILVTGCMILAGCGKQESRIGYVDMNRVVTEAPKVAALNKDFETKMNELMKEKQALVSKEKSMSQEEFQKQAMALNQKQQSIQAGIQSEFAGLIEPLYVQISEEKNLSVILRKENAYQQKTVEHGGIDITDDIIEKLK